jgi:hypothetical protein
MGRKADVVKRRDEGCVGRQMGQKGRMRDG